MYSHPGRRTKKDFRREGYDIARWLMLKVVLDKAERMKTRAGKKLVMGLAQYLVQEMVDYQGDIPEDLPEWAIGNNHL